MTPKTKKSKAVDDGAAKPKTRGKGKEPGVEKVRPYEWPPHWQPANVSTRREMKDGLEWDVTVTERLNEAGAKVVVEEWVEAKAHSTAKTEAQLRGELTATILELVPAWFPPSAFELGMDPDGNGTFPVHADCVDLGAVEDDVRETVVAGDLGWDVETWELTEKVLGIAGRSERKRSMFGGPEVGADGAQWTRAVLAAGSLAVREVAAELVPVGPLDGLRGNTLSWIGDRISWHVRRRLLREVLKATGWNLALAAEKLRAGGSGSLVRLVRDLRLSEEYEAARSKGAGKPGPKPKL